MRNAAGTVIFPMFLPHISSNTKIHSVLRTLVLADTGERENKLEGMI
jgi:hypothetical protein